MTSLESTGVQAPCVPAVPAFPKNSFDDAFKSLEQLLDVLQSTSFQGGTPFQGSTPFHNTSSSFGEHRAGVSSLELDLGESALLPRPSSLTQPDSISPTQSVLQALKTPKVGKKSRPSSFDLQELLQGMDFSPMHITRRMTPMAWTEGREFLEDPHVPAEGGGHEGRSIGLDATLREPFKALKGHKETMTGYTETTPGPVPAQGQVKIGRDMGTQCVRGSSHVGTQCALAVSRDMAVQCDPLSKAVREAGSQCTKRSSCASTQCAPIAKREMGTQCDSTSEQLLSRDDEISRLNALVQAGAEELSSLKEQHRGEIREMRALLSAREDELGNLKVQKSKPSAEPAAKGEMEAALSARHQEALKLTTELHNANWKLQRLQAQQEKELEDCANFLKGLAISSSTPALGQCFDLKTTEVLGMGNYGFVITCRSKATGERVVVKCQSMRWAGVAAKEWAHGSQLNGHSHIVPYLDCIMHRDSNRELEHHFAAGFDSGILTRRRPKFFPDCYFCIALEYMDRGTVQHLLERQPLPPESVGALTRQVASALAFMHKQKRTHNDIKPENILLREAPGGGHLVAKLADLGLADHSIERKRDQDLFAYTVWCMGLRQRFERCPNGEEGQRRAVERFQQAAPQRKQQKGLWELLTKVVSGLWSGKVEVCEVERFEELQELRIALPQDALDLEASAKQDVQQRAGTRWCTHRLRRRGRTVQRLMNVPVDESGQKWADSEPEEESSGDEEDNSLPVAGTWPR